MPLTTPASGCCAPVPDFKKQLEVANTKVHAAQAVRFAKHAAQQASGPDCCVGGAMMLPMLQTCVNGARRRGLGGEGG